MRRYVRSPMTYDPRHDAETPRGDRTQLRMKAKEHRLTDSSPAELSRRGFLVVRRTFALIEARFG